MRRRVNQNALFQSIRGAAEITGLSTRYIRDGCRAGTIPHIMAGNDYRVNMALFLSDLNEQSKAAPGIADGGRQEVDQYDQAGIYSFTAE